MQVKQRLAEQEMHREQENSHVEWPDRTPVFIAGSSGNQLPSLSAFQKSPINTNPVVMEKGLLRISRHLFNPYGSEAFKQPKTRHQIL